MKNTIYLALFHLSFCFTVFAFTHPSAMELHGHGADLIQATCQRTPFYNLCVSTLRSDPRSSGADVAGLARIGAHKLKAKATATLRQITGLLKVTKDPNLKMALSECVDYYNAIVKYDIPEAIEAVVKGDPKFGVEGANDAANEADACRRRFKNQPKFPIYGSNKVVHDLSAVVASIVQLLL
ncbi:Poly(A) polymerase, putative isoform 1 [Hibiscus syriacus]|uniref:Poly(A) polymerase, putative isoform 1 n=1 Tax=Hibiscus syriacus TaxID=106335 RepID=A0A6A3D150_HIBSY|nr:cell wall / vacuolar inhibitor of fructosidase 1-like [Hibiscus syriacus]KAE8733141.1 Poly(A) polymerase, putative isoform 1 [Hibiscus syriacus]